MKTVYRRASPSDPLSPFQFNGSVMIHLVMWPIEDTPHVGVLLVADSIRMSDGTTGNALLIDLKRTGKETHRTFVATSLFQGDVKYVHTLLSLMFNSGPSVTFLFEVPGEDLFDIIPNLEPLDTKPFSLMSEEIGFNCVSVVNEILSRYSDYHVRYTLQFKSGHMNASDPMYSIEQIE